MNHALKLALPVALITVVAIAPAASAKGTLAPLYEKVDVRYTSSKPNAPSGAAFSVALKPVAGQPPVVRRTRIVSPPGGRLDIGAVPACPATDEQLSKDGPGACPSRTSIGRGSARVWIGAGSPLETAVSAFALPRGMLLVLTSPAGAVIRVLRAVATSSQVILQFPRVQLANGDQATLTRFSLSLPKAGTAERPLFRTPKTCPSSGVWTWTYLPVFDAPVGVQRSTSEDRCERVRS